MHCTAFVHKTMACHTQLVSDLLQQKYQQERQEHRLKLEALLQSQKPAPVSVSTLPSPPKKPKLMTDERTFRDERTFHLMCLMAHMEIMRTLPAYEGFKQQQDVSQLTDNCSRFKQNLAEYQKLRRQHRDIHEAEEAISAQHAQCLSSLAMYASKYLEHEIAMIRQAVGPPSC